MSDSLLGRVAAFVLNNPQDESKYRNAFFERLELFARTSSPRLVAPQTVKNWKKYSQISYIKDLTQNTPAFLLAYLRWEEGLGRIPAVNSPAYKKLKVELGDSTIPLHEIGSADRTPSDEKTLANAQTILRGLEFTDVQIGILAKNAAVIWDYVAATEEFNRALPSGARGLADKALSDIHKRAAFMVALAALTR